MAAESKHYLDIHQWLVKVIDSCETEEQCVGAFKLVLLYKERLKKNELTMNVALMILRLEDKIATKIRKIKNGEEISH
jgi:hypothetical protein